MHAPCTQRAPCPASGQRGKPPPIAGQQFRLSRSSDGRWGWGCGSGNADGRWPRRRRGVAEPGACGANHAWCMHHACTMHAAHAPCTPPHARTNELTSENALLPDVSVLVRAPSSFLPGHHGVRAVRHGTRADDIPRSKPGTEGPPAKAGPYRVRLYSDDPEASARKRGKTLVAPGVVRPRQNLDRGGGRDVSLFVGDLVSS